MKENCIFCKIAAGQIPCQKIYEDEHILSFMDINPVSKGHTLVIPKAHYELAHQCPPEIMASLAKQFPKIAGAVYEASGAEGYNLLCNNGTAAGQEVQHLHFHIIPRFSDDGVFGKWPAGSYKQGEMEKCAAKIKDNI